MRVKFKFKECTGVHFFTFNGRPLCARKGNSKMEVANIEKYMPTVYQAEILVKNNLEMYRHKGEKAFKIIHGYGSTGKGGALRTGIRRYLEQLKGAKIIADYIPGENWSVFDETTRKVLDLNDDFSKDRDLGQMNAGVTIIVITWNK